MCVGWDRGTGVFCHICNGSVESGSEREVRTGRCLEEAVKNSEARVSHEGEAAGGSARIETSTNRRRKNHAVANKGGEKQGWMLRVAGSSTPEEKKM